MDNSTTTRPTGAYVPDGMEICPHTGVTGSVRMMMIALRRRLPATVLN